MYEHTHDKEVSSLYQWILTLGSFLTLILSIYLDHDLKSNFLKEKIHLLWYLIAYLLIAFPVLVQAVRYTKKGSFFNEFSLILMATLGVFYQEAAVNRAKRNIKTLLDYST
ncbi:hypothetical protein [Bacteroidetes bacterium endosymbiont of Geopemphigus sp.]|uniref:hypothetical protein n=1 Tax=Bacteroidetes bacterium endosymbiont of Geopemphigus sp. TaxID=2047937 RepID=UPI000CD01CA8|nr:hypothetical protein [Bacteroidetes bacterium endosymbiont of Geopemphigus sp.]